jgi:hypothetical protein
MWGKPGDYIKGLPIHYSNLKTYKNGKSIIRK